MHRVDWVLVSEQTSDDTGSDTCSPMVPDARHSCPPAPPLEEEEEDMEMSPRDENFPNRDRRCATRGPSVVFALGRGGIIIIIIIVIIFVAKGGEGRHSKPG